MMEKIYRTYEDTEVSSIAVNVECPYCKEEWQESDPVCGESYNLICEDGCGKEFKMYFDAS